MEIVDEFAATLDGLPAEEARELSAADAGAAFVERDRQTGLLKQQGGLQTGEAGTDHADGGRSLQLRGPGAGAEGEGPAHDTEEMAARQTPTGVFPRCQHRFRGEPPGFAGVGDAAGTGKGGEEWGTSHVSTIGEVHVLVQGTWTTVRHAVTGTTSPIKRGYRMLRATISFMISVVPA